MIQKKKIQIFSFLNLIGYITTKLKALIRFLYQNIEFQLFLFLIKSQLPIIIIKFNLKQIKWLDGKKK
ncbi:uncharacterized protein EAE97_000324 [Botrytis byssoidea]|uniref:Uncharacterized protein n=1 Tax=Botrytis byssoidea TaxID=139641 RepID=A0A9P5M8Q6_9HELO|nr:uncharacterized protein EAE97_000324 [Botrytis byssoidea]KAF7955065.1 hypothetical protein EAE97_000324 [Botrytis byssoidea]